MKIFSSIRRRTLSLALLGLVLVGTTFTAQAIFPTSFWRIVQIAERLAFVYGGTTNPVERISVETDGRVGLGTGAGISSSALLELKDETKALLVTRVDGTSQIQSPVNGMVVYDKTTSCFKVYQKNAWSPCLGVASAIVVLAQEPATGVVGDVYYNSSNNTLFIHDGTRFVPVTANFLNLVSYNTDCEVKSLANPSLQVRCPNNKHVVSLFYERATFSNTTDNHSIPEVTGVECCKTTFHPFYWFTSDWGTCANNTQSRTVSCRSATDAVVADGLCIAAHRPGLTQSCQTPDGGNGGGGNGGGSCTNDQFFAAFPLASRLRAYPVSFSTSGTYPNLTVTLLKTGDINASGSIAAYPINYTGAFAPVPSVGVEGGITSSNVSSSANARAVCQKIGFNTVVSGVVGQSFTSPHNNQLFFYNGSSFVATNALTPAYGLQSNQTFTSLTCGSPVTLNAGTCTITGGNGGGTATGPSDNLSCDTTGNFNIPAAEFDSLDGSANSFLAGGNNASINWTRCDKQVTTASVDNGGIRINFQNPPRNGNVQLTVNTGNARIYRVAYASNITGATLPYAFTSNRTYVYNCQFNGSSYACTVSQ